jgi:hypothetical protein
MKRIESQWAVLVREFADAGLQCIVARHAVERFPTTEAVVADYVEASEHWTDTILKTSDLVRDCRASTPRV